MFKPAGPGAKVSTYLILWNGRTLSNLTFRDLLNTKCDVKITYGG